MRVSSSVRMRELKALLCAAQTDPERADLILQFREEVAPWMINWASTVLSAQAVRLEQAKQSILKDPLNRRVS